MENNKITEVIWADNTVPSKEMIEKFKFSDVELLTFAINFLTQQYFGKKGFKILDRQNSLNKLPNMVVEKDNKRYGISVVPFLQQEYRYLKDEARIGVTKVLNEKDVISVFCPIGFSSKDKARYDAKVLIKGDNYNLSLRGFVILNTNEKQDLESNSSFIRELE